MNSTALGIIDTHCHLWKIELASQAGLTKEFEPLFRTFGPTDLLQAAQTVGVQQFVLIEAGKTAEENRVLEQMAASTAEITAMAPYVELESPALETELDAWQQNPKFRGVRMRFEGHPDPDILARPSIVAGLGQVARRKLRFEFLVRTGHLKDILRLYERFPDLKGVIEHMAKPDMNDGTEKAEWQETMKALAENTSLFCKLSLSPRAEQIGEILADPANKRWSAEVINPYVQFLLEHFGTGRLMWGSDWPVALVNSNYTDIYQIMRQAIGLVGPADEQRLYRTTAMRFYAL